MPYVALPYFNLLDESWIPVIAEDGERKKAGLLDIFRHADALRAVEHPSPLATAALHRLLLAILYRALTPESVGDVAAWFDDGWPLKLITGYLETWRERLYLFHETHPFWQTPEYDAREKKPWAVLAAEHNASSSEGAKILNDYPCQWRGVNARPEDMACRITAAQTFALPGGRGYCPAPSSAALLAFSLGSNLRETLLLNLPPQEAGVAAQDRPVWEREPETKRILQRSPRRVPAGYADLYTWNSRAVHLHPEADGTVAYVGFKPGIALERENVPVFHDPMAAYRDNGLPMEPNRRGLWRDFDALLPLPPRTRGDDKRRAPLVLVHAEALCRLLARRPENLSVMACGQVNDKAKIEFWRMECFALPAAFFAESPDLRTIVKELLDLAQIWQRWLHNACVLFTIECIVRNDGRQPDARDVRKAVERMPCMAVYWNHLEHSFRRRIENGFADSPEHVERAWLGEIRDALALAWKAQTEAAGHGNVRTIRAMVKAGGTIGKALKELSSDSSPRNERQGW